MAQYDSKTPCQYIYPVQLSNGGEWSLQIYHNYKDWQHLSELPYEKAESSHVSVKYDFPALLSFPLLYGKDGIKSSELPAFASCSSDCKVWRFQKSLGEGQPTGSARVISPIVDTLPLCSKQNPIVGAYFPDETPVQDPDSPYIRFKWHPLGCQLSRDNLKMLDGTQGAEMRQRCLSKARRVMFQGDSHTRMSFDALLPRLRVNGTDLPVFEKAKTKLETVYNTQFEFNWDSHFIRLLEDREGPAAHAIVLSVGSHQCRNKWTFNAFKKFCTSIYSLLKGWQSTPRIIQITPPAKLLYPGDFRTHARVEMWSDVSVFDLFYWSLTLCIVHPTRSFCKWREEPTNDGWFREHTSVRP